MKYRRADSFIADYARLSQRDRDLFRAAVRRMNEAYAARGGQPLPQWPAALRIGSVRDHANVFEMTWSFAGPDGRATFEFIEVDGEPAIRWRRIGDHTIFRQP